MPEIKLSTEPFKMDVKRLYMPGCKITDICPECQTLNELTFDKDNYFNYPQINVKFDYTLCCKECDHEWSIPLIIHVYPQIVP